MADYRDKSGKKIPADAFENEPGPLRDPKETVSAEALARFDKETARIREEARKIKKSK